MTIRGRPNRLSSRAILPKDREANLGYEHCYEFPFVAVFFEFLGLRRYFISRP
jgi:hypothetical protein